LSTIVLGISGALNHDASAALYIDDKLIAAAEEERFIRCPSMLREKCHFTQRNFVSNLQILTQN
jgi:predicted NodU family carbamoyl transferase